MTDGCSATPPYSYRISHFNQSLTKTFPLSKCHSGQARIVFTDKMLQALPNNSTPFDTAFDTMKIPALRVEVNGELVAIAGAEDLSILTGQVGFGAGKDRAINVGHVVFSLILLCRIRKLLLSVAV